MYVNDNNVTCFDSFGVQHIPKEIKKFIENENIIANIYRIQTYDSIKCGYFCIGFIDFMLKSKSISVYKKIIFSWWLWEERWNNTKIFSIESKQIKMYRNVCNKYRKFKKSKIYIFKKTVSLSIVCSKCGHEYSWI